MPSLSRFKPPAAVADRVRVGLLLYHGCLASGLLAVADLLAAANQRAGAEVFQVQWVGLHPGEVETAHGLRLPAATALHEAACDALVVPGFWAHAAAQLPARLAARQSLVQALAALPARVECWAYCTGVVLLAAAGRLGGRAATATWWTARWLSAHHAQVDWQWQHGLVHDGPVVTASGTHGYQSLVARQVEQRLGPDVWSDVERFAVLPRPQPTLAAFRQLDAASHGHPLLSRLQALVEALPAQRLRLPVLAEGLSMSPRTLARRVHEAAGASVGEHVRLLKLRQAGERLLHGGQTVAQVSDALGFASEAGFRRSFRQATGLTPGEFVRGAAPPAQGARRPAPRKRENGSSA